KHSTAVSNFYTIVTSPTLQGLADSIAANDTVLIASHVDNYETRPRGMDMWIDRARDTIHFVYRGHHYNSHLDTTWYARASLNPSTGSIAVIQKHKVIWYNHGSDDSIIAYPSIHVTKDNRIMILASRNYTTCVRHRLLSADLYPSSDVSWTHDTLRPSSDGYNVTLAPFGNGDAVTFADPWSNPLRSRKFGPATASKIFTMYTNYSDNFSDAHAFASTDAKDTVHFLWRGRTTGYLHHTKYKAEAESLSTKVDTFKVQGAQYALSAVKLLLDTASIDTFYMVYQDSFNIIHCIRTRDKGASWSYMKSTDAEAFSSRTKDAISTPRYIYAKNDSIPVVWYEAADTTLHAIVFNDTVPRMTWTGRGTTNNWSDGANWAGGAAPGAGDTAIFDGTSSKNCVVAASVSVRHMEVRTGYKGTIYMRARLEINSATAGNKMLLQDGTLNCGVDTIFLSGGTASLDINGGTFVDSTGCVYANSGTGTNYLRSSGNEFYNILISKSSHALSLNDPTVLRNNLTFVSGQLKGDTLRSHGNVSLLSGNEYHDGIIQFIGSGNQYFYGSTGSGYQAHGAPSVVIAKSGGTLYLSDSIAFARYWIHASGTVDAGNSTIETRQGDSYARYINASGMTFKNMRFYSAGGHQVVLSSNISLSGNFTVAAGGSTVFNANGYDVSIGGNFVNNGIFVSGAGTFTFNGASICTLSTGGTTVDQDFQNLTIAKTGVGSLRLMSYALDVDGAFNITSGSFIQQAQSVTAGSVTIGTTGDWINNTSGTITLGGTLTNNGYLRLDGTAIGCGDADGITLTAASARTVTGTGLFQIQDVAISYMSGTALTVYSCTDNGNNSGITFTGACVTYKTWLGTPGSDSNWNTAANWGPSGVPGASDIVVFDNTSDLPCFINTNATCSGLRIRPGYNGTVTQNLTRTIAIGSNGFNQDGGTFVGGNALITSTSTT
ncbi:MAG: hypothetical protein JNL74_13145, partial [Fibrobacteres bacterium]|nr:hypothetical protein [Fibrobacterota bacterium]